MTVFGISFGNTTSSVAYAKPEGRIEVIANGDGERSIPSVLAYKGSDEFHGSQALAQTVRNAANTVLNFRDYIGKQFDEVDLTLAEGGAKPVKLADGGIGYKLQTKKSEASEGADDAAEYEEQLVSVDEIVLNHLKQLRKVGEDFVGKQSEKAVIAVPTDFTEQQKAKLRELAEKAGLPVLQLISEPAAALLAHVASTEDGSERKLRHDKTYLVADFGGARSDGAVVASRGGLMTILATQHDYELGGNRLDEALMEYFAKEFEKKYKTDPRQYPRALAKLRLEAAGVKKTLSNVQSASVSIDSLAAGYDFHSSINRLRFELVGRTVFGQFVEFIAKLLKKAGLDVLDVDEVVLVGGSAKNQKLVNAVKLFFPASTKVSVDAAEAADPEELVTIGAALQASLLEALEPEDDLEQFLQPVVINTMHLTKAIGLVTADGTFKPVFDAVTAYPARKTLTVKAPAEFSSGAAQGDVLLTFAEGSSEIRVTKVEKTEEDKEKEEEDDEDSDFSDSEDEEDEEIREKVFKTEQKLLDLVVPSVNAGGEISLTVDVDVTGRLEVTAASGDKQVTAAVEANASA